MLGHTSKPEAVQTILCGPPNTPKSPIHNVAWSPTLGTPLVRDLFLEIVDKILLQKEKDEREVQRDLRAHFNAQSR